MLGLRSALSISLRALAANKMRSMLTMLGVIIGVAAVIAMLAVGQGAGKRIGEQIEGMGSNLIIVLPGASTSGGVRLGYGATPSLTGADGVAIAAGCPSVAAVAPELSGVSQLVYGNQNWSSAVRGTTADFLTVRNWSMASGRIFTEQEMASAAKVAVLGQTVVENLYGDLDPVGSVLRIKNMPFTVIGVLKKKGQSAMGRDEDETLLVPLATAQKKLFRAPFPDQVRALYVKATAFEDMAEAERQIKELLRQRHKIARGADDDFTVRNITEGMKAYSETVRVIGLLLGSIASVSLVVGGIGIMNIMLVSVTERTREIGIRMAVGARARDIRAQFLIEALTLSLIGGLIGVGLGIGVSKMLAYFMGWSVLISPSIVALSFGFSGVVGLFFGYYPAWRASMMKPIDALRFE